jgi:ribonuclease T1
MGRRESLVTSIKLVLTGLLLAVTVLPNLVQARVSPSAGSLTTVSVAELPRQGIEVYGLVQRDGPFAYEKDGVVFGNRERLLPSRNRGYYHEYTVKTPGSRDRGGRRIVCGGQPRTPDICYYTADHYASFRKIVP